jgi:hypothetical protein
MAVEDSVIRNPVKAPSCQLPPSVRVSTRPAPVASTSGSPPASAIQVQTRASRSRENSMPMVNSSRTTPMSAPPGPSPRCEGHPAGRGR